MLRAERLSGPAGFRNVSFTLRAGEVLGFAGLVGAGRSEVARAIFGVDPVSVGEIYVRGERVRIASVVHAIRLGLGLVPEDRKRQGLVGSMSVVANATLSILSRIAPDRFLTPGRERRAIGSFLTRLRLRDSARDLPAMALSGGNQQKVVLTKWLAARCPILIFDEPTRGVDVGAKAEIHALIDELASAGTAVILISSEMPELLALSTRILVFRDGQIAGEVAQSDATPDAVMRLMAGVAA
jgi:ABC-type sugar transport system ATPase subunit